VNYTFGAASLGRQRQEQDHESRLARQQLRQGREELATTLQQTRQRRQQLVDIREELVASIRQSFALRNDLCSEEEDCSLRL
jgi:hypothetical protein